jgi:hypothetical protein
VDLDKKIYFVIHEGINKGKIGYNHGARKILMKICNNYLDFDHLIPFDLISFDSSRLKARS